MHQAWIYTIASVIGISLLSLVGILTFSIKENNLKKILIYMIAFSAGALLGDAFLHLIPEATQAGFTLSISIYILIGIGASFTIEKVVHWRHCHHPTTKSHPHHLTTMNLFGDGVHNFLDGIIIGASYLISIPVGIATTIAVIFHEIPQEIGDFSILLYGGFSKTKALLLNFIIACFAILGAVLALILGSQTQQLITFIIPFAAGNFIYIATADLIPELHKNVELKKSLGQLLFFILGILIMVGLTFLEFT